MSDETLAARVQQFKSAKNYSHGECGAKLGCRLCLAWSVLRAELDAILASSVPPAPGWQPIETAPKDGTWVLGYEQFHDNHHPCQRVVYWSDERGCWFDDEYDFAPTHWMPLPAPPARAEREP